MLYVYTTLSIDFCADSSFFYEKNMIHHDGKLFVGGKVLPNASRKMEKRRGMGRGADSWNCVMKENFRNQVARRVMFSMVNFCK